MYVLFKTHKMSYIARNLNQLWQYIAEQYPEYTEGRELADLPVVLAEMCGSFNNSVRELGEEFSLQYKILRDSK